MEQTCVSRLTEVEFYSALSRKVRTGELPKALAHEIIRVFDRHIQSGFFTILRITNAVFDHSGELIKGFKTPLRTLDDLHLACCDHTNTVLLTADRTLAQAATFFGIPNELVETK